MQIRKIDETLSVAPQIWPEDIAEIAQAGFQTVICNRPDGEKPDQPTYDQIAAQAKAAGLEIAFIPFTAFTLTKEILQDFCQAVETMPKPVLAYCGSGTRSATIWALSQAKAGRPLPEIITATDAAGYNVRDALAPFVR